MTATSLFVYYRVRADAVEAARLTVRRLHDALRSRHQGLEAGLWRRPETVDGRVTLMETYARAGGIDAALRLAIEREAAQALAGLVDGERHVEVFERCD